MNAGSYGDYYTGIGAQKTPEDICRNMSAIADDMEIQGLILRSGHARGADVAFEMGITDTKNRMEIYLPWAGFNHAPKDKGYINFKDIDERIVDEAIRMAEKAHPAWHRCAPAARRMHTRNVFQVLGRDLETPSNFVVCWTEKGLGLGGTGQALRIAKQESIPVFDLALESNKERFMEYLCLKELDW